MTTTQMLLTLDDKENKKIEELSKEWKISKMNTIKEIIKRFDK